MAFHDADVREHQGTGEKMVFMRKAFGELKSISESKLLSPSRDQSQIKSQPVQLQLGLSFLTPKRDKPIKSVPARTTEKVQIAGKNSWTTEYKRAYAPRLFFDWFNPL